VAKDTYDANLLEIKGELLEAVNQRKERIVPLAIEVFNKIKDQHINLGSNFVKLDHVQQDNIQQELTRYELLLNNPRSPLYSALRTMGQGGDVKSLA